MAKTKISEFSSTPANNTDIDSINIAEGCAPSGINDAIRELMAQLKDFQTGAQGDSFNGPIGTSTAAAGAFTTLSATGAITSTLATGTAPLVIASTTKVANLNVDLLDGADWASPAALGSTTPAAVSATTLSASSTLSVTGAGSIQGLTVGRGAGAVASNTAVGVSALAANTTGLANDSFGYQSLNSNTTANENVGFGYQTLFSATTGGTNTALGSAAVRSTTTGTSNTGVGYRALYSNTTASNNTAVGYQAGYANTTGSYNVFLGRLAGRANTTADYNVAIGAPALYSNTTGTQLVAIGDSALYNNTTGNYNTAIGASSLVSNTTASNNTAVGYQAGYTNTTGGSDTFLGIQAGYSNTTGSLNTFVGQGSGYYVTTGSKNTILGSYNGNQGGLDIRTASNYIVLSDGDGNPRAYYGTAGSWTFSNSTSTPTTTGWYGVAVDNSVGSIGISRNGSNAMAFFHTSNASGINGSPVGTISITTVATLYNTTSDQRLKENIANAESASTLIDALQVRKFDWKANGSHQRYGFVAQELATVAPEAVHQPENADEMMAVDYSKLVPMLVKEIQSLRKRLADAGI